MLKRYFILVILVISYLISMPYARSQDDSYWQEKISHYYNDLDASRDDQAMISEVRRYLDTYSDASDPTLYAKAQILEAEYLRFLGDYIGANRIVEGIANFQSLAPDLQARIYIARASAEYERGEYRLFLQLSESAMASALESQSLFLQAKALGFLAASKASLGMFDQALQHVDDSLDYLDYIADKRQKAEVLSTIPATYAFLGDIEKGLAIQQEVIQLDHDLNLQQRLEHAYYTLGRLFFRAGRYNDAYVAHQRAYQYGEKFGQIEQIARSSFGLGQAAAKLDLLDEAEQYLSASLPIFNDKGFVRKALNNKIALASVYRKQGRNQEAIMMLTGIWPNIAETEMTAAKSQVLKMLAELYYDKGSYEDAYDWLSLFSENEKQHQINLMNMSASNTRTLYQDKIKALETQLSEQRSIEYLEQFNQKNQDKKFNLIMFSVIGLLLLVSLALWWKFKRAAQQWLIYQSVNPATGIYTATAMYNRLEEEYRRFEVINQPFSVALLSIRETPNLKQFLNGRAFQELNFQVIQILCENIPGYVVLGHNSDDQYMLLLPGMTAKQAESVILPLVELMSNQQFALLGEKNLSLAFGVVEVSKEDKVMLDMIIRAADKLEQDELFRRQTFSTDDDIETRSEKPW